MTADYTDHPYMVEALLASTAPLEYPAAVEVWDEHAPYLAHWRKIGVARSDHGLVCLMAKARFIRQIYGELEHERPFLTSGGPRLGAIRVRPLK